MLPIMYMNLKHKQKSFCIQHIVSQRPSRISMLLKRGMKRMKRGNEK